MSEFYCNGCGRVPAGVSHVCVGMGGASELTISTYSDSVSVEDVVLPELDITEEDMEAGLLICDHTPGTTTQTQGDCNFAALLGCRERQLLDALRKLDVMDTEARNLNAAVSHKETIIAEALKTITTLRAQISELQKSQYE